MMPQHTPRQAEADVDNLRVVSLFSGIGALDRGLEQAGLRVVEMCESWAPARRVLQDRFPGFPLAGDVADYLPACEYEVLAAGFPCTDLSHAGGKAGILGQHSGLVSHVFRIAKATRPQWIALENVPNLLSLHQGAGMRYIAEHLEGLGYRWAFRTVDSRATGVPQRRPRVLVLASRDYLPGLVLLSGEATPSTVPPGHASGFYWTEGRNGLGLVDGAIPTLKGGSTLGLASAPAIWFPHAKIGRRFVLPDVGDGEALQGLPRGWTTAAVVDGEPNLRWKLIGNAVTMGVGRWLGECIVAAQSHPADPAATGVFGPVRACGPLDRGMRWPQAGFGAAGQAWESTASAWPIAAPRVLLADVVDVERARPLSYRATSGFLSRLDESGRAVPQDFYRDLEAHQQAMRPRMPGLPRQSWASSDGARRRMQAQRQRDTSPEIALRRALTALGLRYRLHVRPVSSLRARLDIVFPGAKVAVDIRGCFWHSCPTHRTSPRANADRWEDKLARNVARDARTAATLEEAGWEVVVVWEHEDATTAASRVFDRVQQRRSRRPTATTTGGALPDVPPASEPASVGRLRVAG